MLCRTLLPPPHDQPGDEPDQSQWLLHAGHVVTAVQTGAAPQWGCDTAQIWLLPYNLAAVVSLPVRHNETCIVYGLPLLEG